MTRVDLLNKYANKILGRTTVITIRTLLGHFMIDLFKMEGLDEVEKNSECLSKQKYSDCHIHNDSMTGCIGCGNFKIEFEDTDKQKITIEEVKIDWDDPKHPWNLRK